MVDLSGKLFTGHSGAASLAGSDVGTLIGKLLPNIFAAAGVIFVILIFVAGFPMIAGAGKDASAQDKAKAQAALTFAVAGFLLVVTSYFILHLIGRIVGVNFLSAPNL
jgi:hypothetical protein